MLLIKKSQEKMQETSIETFQKKNRIKKRKYQRERYRMNSDLKERLNQYQRNYYDSKTNKQKIIFTV